MTRRWFYLEDERLRVLLLPALFLGSFEHAAQPPHVRLGSRLLDLGSKQDGVVAVLIRDGQNKRYLNN